LGATQGARTEQVVGEDVTVEVEVEVAVDQVS
jgi:hypothetical protein